MLFNFSSATLAAAFVFLASCNAVNDGEIQKGEYCNSSSDYYIEDAESQYVYLRNNSESKVITFTVQSDVHTTEPSVPEDNVSTKTYTLSPGEREALGCEKKFQRFRSGEIDSSRYCHRKHKIVGAVVEKG